MVQGTSSIKVNKHNARECERYRFKGLIVFGHSSHSYMQFLAPTQARKAAAKSKSTRVQDS